MKKHTFFALICALFCSFSCSVKERGSELLYELDYIPVQYDDSYIYLDMVTGKRAVGSQVYDDASYFYEGMAIVSKDDSLRFINNAFETVSDAYAAVTIFNSGVAYTVKPGGCITAINKSGDPVFVLKDAEYALRFNDGVSVFATADNEFGLVNTEGKVLISPGKYEEMGPIGTGGMLPVGMRTKHGIKRGISSYDGTEIIPCEYDQVIITDDSINNATVFIVNNNGDYGVVDVNNNEIVPIEYTGLFVEPDGNILFSKYYRSKGETRYGWMTPSGDELIAPLFSDTEPFFSSKLTAAECPSEELYGFIDKKGEWAIEPKFEMAGYFNDSGLAVVENKVEEYGAINVKGEYVIKPKYDEIRYLGEGLYIVYIDDESGVIDSKGEIVVKLSDIYRYDLPEIMAYDDEEYAWVQSMYLNVDAVVNKMLSAINLLKMDDLSRTTLQNKFNATLEGYGWRKLIEEYNNFFSYSIDAFVDYESGYSFYDGYYQTYYITDLKVEFNLTDDKVRQNRPIIYNALAKALGSASVMNENGYIETCEAFQQSILPEWEATMSNMCVNFVPKSGRLE